MFGSMGQTNVKNLGNGGTMDGDVTITGDLTVSGGIGLSLSEVIQGTSTIDINSTEAFLVRKDGDGGDVFVVDTTNEQVKVGDNFIVNASGTTPVLTITGTRNDILFTESDTSNLNTLVRQQTGLFRIDTINDALDTITRRLTIDHSTGNIGINGTPAQLLDLHGATGATLRLTSTNTNITGSELVGKLEAYISDASGNLPAVAGSIDWTTNGSIDGGSTKGTTLTLKNYLESAGLQTVLTIDKDKQAMFYGNVELPDNTALNFGDSDDSQFFNNGSAQYFRNNSVDMDFIFQVNDGGSTQTEVMRIDASVPSVNVTGEISASNTLRLHKANASGLTDYIAIRDSGTSGVQSGLGLGTADSTLVLFVDKNNAIGAGSALVLQTGGTDALTINGSQNATFAGNVNINNSSSNAILTVKTTAAAEDARVIIDRDDNNGRAYLKFADTDNSYNWFTGLLRSSGNNYAIGTGDDFGTNTHLSISSSGDATFGGAITSGGNVIIPAGNLLYLDGGTDTYIYQETDNKISFATNSGVRLSIDNSSSTFSGNVLIDNDSATISVRDNSAFSAGTGGAVVLQGKDSNENVKAFALVQGISKGVNNGELILQTRNSGTLTTALTIDDSQNVGIGTDTPSDLLEIRNGTNDSTAPRVQFGVENTFVPTQKFYKWAGASNLFYAWRIEVASTADIGFDIKTGGSSATAIGSESLSSVLLLGADKSATFSGTINANAGINFPDTQVASSDANTLDDYEEGAWSPVIKDNSNNAMTMDGATGGRYVKIGSQVSVTARVQTTSVGSASGNIKITGLPFTSTNAQAYKSGARGVVALNLNITAGESVAVYLGMNTTELVLYVSDATTGDTVMQSSEWSDDGHLIFNFSYFV